MAFDTRLIIAVDWNNIEEVQSALDSGEVNVNFQTGKKYTALHVCVNHPTMNNEILELLLKTPDINLNLQNDQGNTPLHLAVQHDLPYAVKRLIEQGAQTDIENYEGKTPVEYSFVKK